MATTSQILAHGTTATQSSEFDVDSTPVTVIARLGSGALGDSGKVGTLQRKDSTGAFADVNYVDDDNELIEVNFRKGSMERTVVAPGTYRVNRPSLSGRGGTPSVGFDKVVSA